MDRVRALALSLVLAATAWACQPAQTQDAGRPNVLIVVTDDERAESHIATPNLYDWFEGGTIFERAYVTTPHCCPSRASIFTGRYVHNHGVGHQREIGKLAHDETIQHALKEAGYATGFVGKFINRWPKTRQPPHFDRWTLGEGYASRFIEDGEVREVDYSTDYVFERGRDYVSEWDASDDTKPWLLMLSPYAPHAPYAAAPEHESEAFPWEGTPATDETDLSDKPRYVRKGRYSEESGIAKREAQLRTMRSVDDAFMATIEHLERLGELDRTIVIYLSDNGYLWAEHGLIGKGVPYEGAVRVPMYMRGPGIEAERTERLVANIDVAPTVFDLTGVDAPFEVDGRSVFGDHTRRSLLLEYEGGRDVPRWTSIVTATEQYIEYADGFREFYDLEHDYFQLENEPDDVPPELVDELHRIETCAGDDCP